MTETGDLVRARRQAKGWSQARLARESGLGQKKLSFIETGVTKTLDPATAAALVRALPLSIYELLEAMGYELPEPRIPRDILAMLEAAPRPVQDAVRLTLRGWQANQNDSG